MLRHPQVHMCPGAASPDLDPDSRGLSEGQPGAGRSWPRKQLGSVGSPKCHSSDPRACVPGGLQRFSQAPPPAFHLHWEGLQGPLQGRVPPSKDQPGYKCLRLELVSWGNVSKQKLPGKLCY